jgi:hypothetical protein
MTSARIGALAACLVAMAASGADAALCRTKSGALVVRTACTRKKPPVDLAALGAARPTGDPGPRGTSSPRLRALDANGTFIGYLNAVGDVLVRSGSHVIFVAAGTEGFVEGGTLSFEAPACTGPPLVSGSAHLVRPAPVHGTTAYAQGDPVVARALLSYRGLSPAQLCTGAGTTYDPATGTCCRSLATTSAVGPAIPIDLGGLTSPFRVEIEQ